MLSYELNLVNDSKAKNMLQNHKFNLAGSLCATIPVGKVIESDEAYFRRGWVGGPVKQLQEELAELCLRESDNEVRKYRHTALLHSQH